VLKGNSVIEIETGPENTTEKKCL